MKYVRNLIALGVGFGVGFLTVLLVEGLLATSQPDMAIETAAYLSKGIGAFVGGLLITVIAHSSARKLGLVFGVCLFLSEVVMLSATGEATAIVVFLQTIFIFAAFVGVEIGEEIKALMNRNKAIS